MENSASYLLDIIEFALPRLRQLTETDACKFPAPGKWSKKQIIGHLIDSANNNQQKFVRLIVPPSVHLVGYEQNEWVDVQHYKEENWEQLLQFWEHFNRHLAHVIRYIPPTSLPNQIYINNAGPFTLEFIVRDYIEHLKHHLKSIFPNEDFLNNSFSMFY